MRDVRSRAANPISLWNAWSDITMRSAQLAFEAQSVIALRWLKFAAGHPRARAEAQRMVTEKVAALAEAQITAATTAMRGGDGIRVGKKVLGVYKKKVRRNRRRLVR